MRTSLQELVIEPLDQHLLVANPRVGALSLLDEAELLALTAFVLRPERETLVEFIQTMGVQPSLALVNADGLFRRFREEGWLRSATPKPETEHLVSVYFTITKECNLSCPYCYAGLKEREGKRMTIERARRLLDMIREVNPRCGIILTGGEPFTHPGVMDILEEARRKGFEASILTNGSLIDEAVASRLAAYENLALVQVSVDGMSERVHGITRGTSHRAAWAGIHHLIDHGVTFAVSPTLHEKNLHEAWDMAAFALAHGGFFGPNHLKVLPQSSGHNLRLSNESLTGVLSEVSLGILEEYGEDGFGMMTPPPLQPRERGKQLRTLDLCGVGEGVVDIDWNGDVYPCNILKRPEFLLGNLFCDGFDAIFKRVKELGIRVRSYDIPKCSRCVFVGTCAGGCRAGSEVAFGSFDREDNLCSCLYEMNRRGLLLRHYRKARDLDNCKRVLRRQIESSVTDVVASTRASAEL
jgi:radical SAM protein with 4Fe4S-binding SPASM domain